MRIHALSTGTVRVKHSFLFAGTGPRRQLDLFLPGPFSAPLPIHLWVVEHAGERILVDTGETTDARDIPFARFAVTAADELPAALAGIGLAPGDIDTVVLTHMHGDHADGAVHLGDRPVLVSDTELAYSRGATSRFFRRVLRQPLPSGVRFDAGRARRRAVRRVRRQPAADRRWPGARGRHARAHPGARLDPVRRRRRAPRPAGRRCDRHARAAALAAPGRGGAQARGVGRHARPDPRPRGGAPDSSTCPPTTRSPRGVWPRARPFNESDAVPSHLGTLSRRCARKRCNQCQGGEPYVPWLRSLRLGSASSGNFPGGPFGVKGGARKKPHPPRKRSRGGPGSHSPSAGRRRSPR